MEKQSHTQKRVLNFRHWSRKSYAVFSSLGKLIRIGVLCLAYSILVMPCKAQDSRDTLQSRETISGQELEEVVVSAQRGPVVQSQLMRVVQVISRTEIEQAPTHDLGGLLETVRGVDIRKRGTFGMQADVSIRGGTFDQTLILINGINLTDPQTGHHNLNVPVDLMSIERIEVLQGAGARIFGPNAFNGAINIITNQPGKDHATFSLTGGEYGFGAAGASAGFGNGPLQHYFSLNGMKSDGFANNTDFKTGNLFYRTVSNVGNSKLDAQAGYNQKAFGANSFYTPRFPDQFEETRTGFASLQFVPSVKLNMAVYWRRHHDRFELFRHDAPEWYTTHNYHRTDVAGASLNWMHTGALGRTSLGLDYRFEHIYSNVLGELMNNPIAVKGYNDAYFIRSYHRSGVSIMGEQSYYAGPFSVSSGLLTYLNPELEKGISFFPGLDVGWQLTDNLRWFSSVNRTLRLPTFTDLFYSGPGNMGNPDLKPEKAISLEMGVKNRWKSVEADFAVFRRWGIDMIDWIKEPGDDQWQSMNLTRVNITGLEAGTRIPLIIKPDHAETLSALTINYSYIHSGKSSGDFVSNYALDHLRHKLDLGFTHTITPRGGASYRASWQQRSGGFMLYSDGVFNELQDFEPFWMVDVKLFYKIRQIMVFAEVSNLFDKQYVTIANVPQPGRWARVGISGNFTF
jgi:vitamin B12 transporter